MNQDSDFIALTGCGWVTPFATGSITEVLTRAGQSGAADAALEERPGDAYWPVPDERVQDFPELSRELKSDKGAWMTAVALIHACRDASLQLDSVTSERMGLFLGCGLAGQLGMIEFANEVRQQSARFVSPIHFPQTVGNYIAGALGRGFHIRGPNLTLAGGFASALHALREGCAALLRGSADMVIAGGIEPLSPVVAQSFPESDVRLSEGACLFILERAADATARGAKILARVTAREDVAERPKSAPGAPGDAGTSRTRDFAAPGSARGSEIVSVAGWRCPGAVFIEHWIGRCLGTLGAAAVAAVIGATQGYRVPLLDKHDGMSVSIGRIDLDTARTPDAAVPATIIADVDGTSRSAIGIAIPAPG